MNVETLTVSLPVLPLHEAMLAAGFLREAPYLVAMRDHDAVRCLREAATAVARGNGSVSLTTTRSALGPLASACQRLAAETYSDNPAVPVLSAIADACEA